MIDKKTGLWIYNKMHEIRDFEETAWTLFTENKLRGSVHLYTGEEAVAASVCAQLTDEDLKDETNPYNTYTHKGLPPGPISNPSQNSIAAALECEDTDYFYYAYDPATKLHHFSKTYAEHLAFLESLKKEAA